MEDKQELLTLYGDDVVVTRSNEFIRSKYKATLLESKLLILSISRLQNENYGANRDLKVSFSAAELKTLLNEEDSKSIYSKLRYSSRRLMQNFFVFQDREKNDFKMSVIVKDCEYKDGIFTVEFNKSIKEHIFKLTSNYTPMKLSILLGFSKGRTNSAYRIYEILRTHLYKIKPDQTCTVVRYDVYDFMLSTGQIDINSDKVQDALASGKSAEYIVNNIVTAGKNAKNTEWRDFRRRVLEPAIEEINEITDIYVKYKTIRGGVGGKVKTIDFEIYRKKNYSSAAIEDFKVDADMLMKFEDLIPVTMSTKDKTAIIKMAAGNFERIKNIYDMAASQAEVRDLVAWMITGLREEWDLHDSGTIHLVRGDDADPYQEYADAANEDIIDMEYKDIN